MAFKVHLVEFYDIISVLNAFLKIIWILPILLNYTLATFWSFKKGQFYANLVHKGSFSLYICWF